MKTLILLLAIPAISFADCKNQTSETSTESKEVSKVAMPKSLKGATITLKAADGKEYKFKAEDYMVAQRVKTTKVVHYTVNTVRTCEPAPVPTPVKVAEKNNEIMVGVRRDYTGMDKSSSPTSVSVESKRNAVFDATYMRHRIFGTRLNLGAGLDTNGTPRGVLGIDF